MNPTREEPLPPHILDYIRAHMIDSPECKISTKSAKSAQQRVWILTAMLPDNNNLRLVVRLWKSARRWWNLNQCDDESSETSTLQAAALSEVTAYRLARNALADQDVLCIPRVLHFCNGENSDNVVAKRSQYPWAVLEYVGAQQRAMEDTTWADGMIPVRLEFGFDEPHPRWGRLPVDQCLIYAQIVLETVIVPLHKKHRVEPASRFVGLEMPQRIRTQNSNKNHVVGVPSAIRGFRYMDMIQIYQEKYKVALQRNHKNDDRLQQALSLLEKAIVQLEQEAAAFGLDKSDDDNNVLPCVLCHMDFQPQNLLFAQKDDSTVRLSVLDWEEAAYADPRFELLLLCRKVVANRTQADQLWESYQNGMSCQLGPIDPWLRLETVHSITTLLLQACVGGGRSPWEAKPDLWGKIDREFQRLAAHRGWSHCTLPPATMT